ncbi:hypothetical protein GNI_120750 [Gregarina niphandrodes]|uniref:Uncharacterized protein n=1 Tax=Gregarina niphandrodes TaxID=110365 RepID=A0A023B2K8_GRENI|nr:hypothetical protein GNI_120750 [Gregarina niphandrodes]EZG54460.1 hypothetical protein GNI_120750 [Gregarina niphandrodes]|eukprot:XP_011131847.1 hypothetical protein GNI_120750 [Gregarina niphandrodes]
MKTIRCAIEGGVQVDSLLAMLVAENGSQPPLTDDCVAGVVTIESAGKAPVEALVLAPEQSFMKFKINGFNWREDALRIKIYRRPGDSSADIDYETDPTNPLYLDEASNPHGYTDDNNSMFSDGATEGGTTAASYDGSFGVSSVNTFGDGHDTGHVAGQSTLSYAESMATLKKQLADIEWSLAATGGKDATLQRKAGYRDPRGGEERDDVEEPLLGDFKDAGTLGRKVRLAEVRLVETLPVETPSADAAVSSPTKRTEDSEVRNGLKLVE